MARERFRVVAKDAHFNDELCRMPYPADSEDRLRELIGEKAPNLTIVRIDPIKMAMYRELHEARSNVRIFPDTAGLFDLPQIERERAFARRELVEERLKSCCALAERIGLDAQENLSELLRRFDLNVEGRFALTGLYSSAFSLAFRGGPDYALHGGLIFHASSRQWGTHT